jgi:hypothetical protein
MFARLSWQFSIVVLSLFSAIAPAVAQVKDAGGNAAQDRKRIRNQDIGNYSVNEIIRADLRSGQARGLGGRATSSIPRRSYSDMGIRSSSSSKPFSTVSPTPTVSPYLNLFREDLGGNDDLNYQTLVRPQLEQQRTNALLQRQNEELSRRVQSISAQRDYNPGGAQNQYPTGHPTVFNYHGRYYPSAARRR